MAQSFLNPTTPQRLDLATPHIFNKFKQEFLLVTSMSNMPDMARQKITICTWHFAPLWFLDKNSVFKRNNRPFKAQFLL